MIINIIATMSGGIRIKINGIIQGGFRAPDAVF